MNGYVIITGLIIGSAINVLLYLIPAKTKFRITYIYVIDKYMVQRKNTIFGWKDIKTFRTKEQAQDFINEAKELIHGEKNN